MERAQWQRIVWTDESAVGILTKDGRLSIWINSKNKIGTNMFNRLEQGNGGGFLVWAAIWMNGHSEIKIIKGTMNGDRYVSVLENEVYPLSFQLGDPSSDWLLMDDNATSHRCCKVK